MLLDIQKLLAPGAEPAEGRQTLDLSGQDFYGYTVPQPVMLTYRAQPMPGQVELTIEAGAVLQAECARCLAEASLPLHIERSWFLTAEDLREDFPELPLLPGGMLDVQELVYGEIVMEAPGAILCREDCPGLCQRCGKPPALCACPPQPVGDPRLQVLRQLLDDDN